MSDHSDDEPILAAGTVIAAKYEILRRLGAGGMGAVYEARHKRMGKKVALKVIHRKYAKNADAVVRFLREAEAASKIRHPNVIDVIDIDELHDPPFMVLEYLEGLSLASILEREGKLGAQQTAALLSPILSAVAAAHEAGIVHRDIKPENVFVARTGDGSTRPVILDFGVAKIDGGMFQGLTQTNAMVGTVVYMSPEQARDSKRVDARSDQYTLGVLLYECLAGQRPVDGESLYSVLSAIVEGKFQPLRELAPGTDPAFLQIVERAMQRNPDDRFASVRAMNEALAPFVHPGGFVFQRDSWVVEYAFGSTMTAEGSEKSAVADAVQSVTGKRPGELSADAHAAQVAASSTGPLSGPTIGAPDPKALRAQADTAPNKRVAPSSTLGQSAVELPVALSPNTLQNTTPNALKAQRGPSTMTLAFAGLGLIAVAALSVKFLFGSPPASATTTSASVVNTTQTAVTTPLSAPSPLPSTILDAAAITVATPATATPAPPSEPAITATSTTTRARGHGRGAHSTSNTTQPASTPTTTAPVAAPVAPTTPAATPPHSNPQQVGGGFVL
jgi:serine/threonine-protein kinase